VAGPSTIVRVSPSSGGVGRDGRRRPGALVYLHGGRSGRDRAAALGPDRPAGRRNGARTCGCRATACCRSTPPRTRGLSLDALADRLRKVGRVHVLGDSAGGNLALLAAQSWGEVGTGPEVVGVTLIAPWLDLSLSNPRFPRWRGGPGGWTRSRCGRWGWRGRRARHAGPGGGPLFGRLTGLPPMAVLVGTRGRVPAGLRGARGARGPGSGCGWRRASRTCSPSAPTP
jgi:hypothetical protein